MAYTAPKILTFETFLDRYCDNFRYELADGELVYREPTGSHETVSGKLATQIGIAIAAEKLLWFIPRTCLIRPFSDAATARRPDIVVLDESAILGIPEYWIVDYRVLGGVAFIGKPKQPTITVCQLIDQNYIQQQFRLGQPIISPLLKSLQLRLDDILPR